MLSDYNEVTLCPIAAFPLCSLQYESDEQEKSAYQEYDSDSDVPEELKQDYVDEQTGDVPVKRWLTWDWVALAFLWWLRHNKN